MQYGTYNQRNIMNVSVSIKQDWTNNVNKKVKT